MIFKGHLEISTSATRHQHQHWHCEILSSAYEKFFEKIEHLCSTRLNIFRWAYLPL